MADLSQLEVDLINHKKAEIYNELQSVKTTLAQVIPLFNGRADYVAEFDNLMFTRLLNDPQLESSILSRQTDALYTAICTDLSEARKQELGIENLCE